jgi:hypothetical protein
MPGYLELLRQHRMKTGEAHPPNQRGLGANLANPQASQTPSPFLRQSPDVNIKNKFFNDFNEGCVLEKRDTCEVARLARFGKLGTPPSYVERFEVLLARCPEGVLNQRYMQAVTDAECFLATWGSQAQAFGWTADDLFGLNPAAPLRRYDVMGLVWLLQGRPVIALTERTAVLGGELHPLTFYRRTADFPWRRRR